MTQDTSQIPSNQGNLFERLLFSLGFAIVAYLTLMLLFAMAIAQFVLRALDSTPNGELARFIRRLSIYLASVAAFIALASDHRPFPFGEFPPDPDRDGGSL